MDLYDCFVIEYVPEVVGIGRNPKLLKMAHTNTFHNFSIDPMENWKRLDPALEVLTKVCPKAAGWVRQRHSASRIVWQNVRDGNYASYNLINQQLTLNESFCVLTDGRKATILAHEFRHAQQNWTKFARCSILTMVTGSFQSRSIEDDATIFEQEVQIAIFDAIF